MLKKKTGPTLYYGNRTNAWIAILKPRNYYKIKITKFIEFMVGNVKQVDPEQY